MSADVSVLFTSLCLARHKVFQIRLLKQR